MERDGRRTSGDCRHVSRRATRRRWQLPLSWRARTPAVDGPDAEGLQGSVARLAVPGARVVGAAGPQPRAALRRAEHTRDQPRHRTAVAVLRPACVAAALLLLLDDDTPFVVFEDVIFVPVLAGRGVVVLFQYRRRDDLTARLPLKRDDGGQIFLQCLVVLLGGDRCRETGKDEE